MLDGGFGRIAECVSFDDPSYDLMKFHLILRYVHELYTSVQVLIKLSLGLVPKVHCQAISQGKINCEDHS
jgi:hypothetical protein